MSARRRLPTGSQLEKKLTVLAVANGVGVVIPTALYMWALLRLSPEQWKAFWQALVVVLPGEERTIGYLIARMQETGLEPGGPDGQWLQTVPLLHTKLTLVALTGLFVVWHMKRPNKHVLESAIFLVSLAVVWLGISL